MNQQLMKHGIYFISQLISSGGDRLLNYRDLRITLGINTKGRKPSWFKFIEQKCLLEKDLSRRLKGEFHTKRSYKSISNDLVSEVKKRNWLAFYHEKNAVAYLGRVIETGTEGMVVEHWIHDIGVENISPSVQLPIIKKCSGCDLKEIHTKSKKKGVKQRYMSVFKCIAQAKNNGTMKIVDNGTDQTPSNLLTFIHPPKVRNDLIKIKDSLESVKNIEAYTDESFKKHTLTAVDMGSAFLISSPKRFEFNANITDNPSAFKAELIAIILVLLICPKDANITIYVDAQAIINIFNQLKKESLQQISKGKRPYNVWWILGFKIIKFFKLSVQLVKVKAHNNSEYNNMVDNLAKNAVSKDPIYIDLRLLIYKGNIEEFFNLHRNECWNNSETLAEIEWPCTFRVLKGNMELTNFSEYELNSFKVKIRTEELPTLDNLIKRKPHVYSSKWKCPMCLKDDETYSHLWKCEHLRQVNQNMIGKLQQYIQDLILMNSQEENLNSENILKEILLCRIWDFNKTYNLSMLAKGFVHIDLVNLFKSYKIIDKDRIRLLDKELPTLDNLIKRKPHVYSSKWKCPMCLKDDETYSHLWKCEHLRQVNQNMIGKLQQYIQDLILMNSQEENLNSENILKEILLCRIWDFNKTYNLSMLAKGFVHIDLVNLFKSYKIIDKDRIRLLDSLINKLIFNFKIFIWEYRNVKLVDLEHQKGINAKMKRSANKSKFVVNKLDKIVSSRWELWNSLVFDKGGHWSNF
ncbi:hypothetical protein RhiirA4_450213 [Rhizophagus irregularis]|uniref:RNase H type-1 domain-containing protein n=1 Tax=Rhizophagus irregularis TaxID=588596 RepID=A0A2I1FSM8_9GLOM|nr:hypothetical protein RhiirA4_450213 [Rhizophagus irregularis]